MRTSVDLSFHQDWCPFILTLELRQDPVNAPKTKEGHEPSDNLTNALKQKDMVNYEHKDVNDNSNHIGYVEVSPLSVFSALDFKQS